MFCGTQIVVFGAVWCFWTSSDQPVHLELDVACRAEKGWFNSGYIFPEGFKSQLPFRSAFHPKCLPFDVPSVLPAFHATCLPFVFPLYALSLHFTDPGWRTVSDMFAHGHPAIHCSAYVSYCQLLTFKVTRSAIQSYKPPPLYGQQSIHAHHTLSMYIFLSVHVLHCTTYSTQMLISISTL